MTVTAATAAPANPLLLDNGHNFDTMLIGKGAEFCYVLSDSAGRYGRRWVLNGAQTLDVDDVDPAQEILDSVVAAINEGRLDETTGFSVDCSSELILLLLVTDKLSRDSLKLVRAFENRLEIPFGLPTFRSLVTLQVSRSRATQPAQPIVLPWDAPASPEQSLSAA